MCRAEDARDSVVRRVALGEKREEASEDGQQGDDQESAHATAAAAAVEGVVEVDGDVALDGLQVEQRRLRYHRDRGRDGAHGCSDGVRGVRDGRGTGRRLDEELLRRGNGTAIQL